MSSCSVRPDHRVSADRSNMAYHSYIVYDHEYKHNNKNYFHRSINGKDIGKEEIKNDIIKNSQKNNKNNAVRISKSSKICTPELIQVEHTDPSSTLLTRKNKVCELCGKSFAKRSDLINHRRIHTREKPYKCRFCSKRYSDPSNLNKHEKRHPQFSSGFLCEACRRSFEGRRGYTNHMRACHKDLVPRSD